MKNNSVSIGRNSFISEITYFSFRCAIPALVVQEAASLEWDPEDGKVLQPVQTAIQAAPLFGLFDP